MKKLNFLQKFLHNKLGWGYPTCGLPTGGDSFQPTYTCICEVPLARDSTGALFHLGEVNQIN